MALITVVSDIKRQHIFTVEDQHVHLLSRIKLIWVRNEFKCLKMILLTNQIDQNFYLKYPTEKHKSYHFKDEQLNKDGFKKFMKHEECLYPNCRFSRVCNHIHCIREGCNYVLHSSGQLYSHKVIIL